MNILIAEDDYRIAQSLRKSFQAGNHRAEIAEDGRKTLDMLAVGQYDALLLDWRMPKLSGLEVCRRLREEENSIPIILLTALTDLSNKVEALDAGADDYITKPFSFEEVLARLNAVIRRSALTQNHLTFGELRLDLVNRQLIRKDQSVKLPEMEFELFKYLIEHSQEIVSKEQLASNVWKLSFLPATNFIEATIKNLRKKLESFGAPKYIKTVYGEGYSLIND